MQTEMPTDRPPLASIDEVRRLVASQGATLAETEKAPLARARGRVLARTLASPRALPVFDHSAMDGYALALMPEGSAYRIVGSLSAGRSHPTALQPGEALRIFTGAPIPAGADAVVMQEMVDTEPGRIRISRPVAVGDNIRRAGEDVAAGAVLASSGTLIDARHIGLAAATGLAELEVHRILRVALLSSGDELTAPGSALGAGQIYDSNRPMLAAALERPAITIHDLGILPDRPEGIGTALHEAAAQHDLIISTGGASVGDEDHLARALLAAGGHIEIARAAIRPGKPFIFGRLGETPVAILPGNPFAALVAALVFVRPMIERAIGMAPPPFAPLVAAADFACPRTASRTEFLPARITGRSAAGLLTVERLGRGGSARLKPLIEADGLAVITPGPDPINPGDAIGFLPFGAAFSL